MEVSVPFSFLGTRTPETVKVIVAGSTIEVPTFKKQVIVYNLLALFGILAIIIIIAFVKFKKINLKSPLPRFKVWRAKKKNENELEKTDQTQTEEGKTQ